MFKKIGLVVCLLLLVGCKSQRVVSCLIEDDDKIINLNIKANYDDISGIHVIEALKFPKEVILDKEKCRSIIDQFDDGYYLVDNMVVNEYDEKLDKTYSLKKTIESLNKEYFYCE